MAGMRFLLIGLCTLFGSLGGYAQAASPRLDATLHLSSIAPDTPDTGSAPSSEPAKSNIQDLLLYALSLNGTHYRYGGSNVEAGFDCSGFVSHVFNKITGIVLPRNAREISHEGEKIRRTDLQPGDLVFFNTLRRTFSHVGIYLGDNRFIHASSSATGDVMISDMTENYWSHRFNGGRRLLPGD